MVRGRGVLGAAILIAAGVMLAGPADRLFAEEPGAEEDREPALEGEALRQHEADVRKNLEKLLFEKNKVILIGTIQRLGKQGARAGRDALIEFASRSKDQEYILEAFRALGHIGDRTSVEFLCGKQALRARSFMTQQSAATALAIAKSPRASAPLLEVMTGPRTKIEVVGACALALAQSDPRNEEAVKTLFEYSRHKSDTIRSNVLEALGHLGSDEAIARLAEALEKDRNTRARGAAATGMMNSGRRDTIPYLQKALANDASLTVKDCCMRAIQTLTGGD